MSTSISCVLRQCAPNPCGKHLPASKTSRSSSWTRNILSMPTKWQTSSCPCAAAIWMVCEARSSMSTGEFRNSTTSFTSSIMNQDPNQYGLADFFFSDSPNVIEPPEDYTHWREAVKWATSLYEPTMHGGPIPRTQLQYGEETRPMLNFASYNYLGLAQHPETVEAARQALLDYGNGACGSLILS